MSGRGDMLRQSGGRGPLGVLERADLVIVALVALALLLHPTQLTIPVVQWVRSLGRAFGPLRALTDKLPGAPVTVTDTLFFAAFLLWLVVRWRQGRLREHVRRYPLALVAVFACACLSLVPFLKPSPPGTPPIAYDRGVKQLVQLFLLFVCTYVVVVDCLGSPRWRGKLILAFCVAVAIALVVGSAEYMRLRAPSPEAQRAGAFISPMDVDATFGFRGEPAGGGEKVGTASNRNVLGAWLTLVLPLLWGVFLYARRTAWRAAALAMALAGGLLLLHAGLWAAALVAILALSFGRGPLVLAGTAAGMLVFYSIVFLFGPQNHGQILLDSVMLRRSVDRFRTLPLYEGEGAATDPAELVRLENRPYSPWEQKYVEWQPALLALAHNPLFGVGLGNYQVRINAFYADRELGVYQMPKASENLMEHGGNSFCAVWLVQTGFVGLVAFIWLILSFVQSGASGARASEGLTSGLKRGACAALGAASLGALFTDYWVRGVGTAFVFVLALASFMPSSGERE